MLKRTVRKIGSSLGLTLPSDLVDALELEGGEAWCLPADHLVPDLASSTFANYP